MVLIPQLQKAYIKSYIKETKKISIMILFILSVGAMKNNIMNICIQTAGLQQSVVY